MEPIAARAWRAAEESRLGGWRLYASSGYSGRINACWPLADPGVPLDQAIGETEAWYQARSLRPMFKIVDEAECPSGLIPRLESLGYRSHTPTLMMVGIVDDVGDAGVLIEETVSEAFGRVFAAAGAGDPGDARERLEALERIATPRGFARIECEGVAAAIGACAVEGEWTGIFAMRTAPDHRRQGLARRVLAALLARSHQAGARRAYLQVEAPNAPAIALYERAGFELAYSYSYWTRP